jgi:hypothetical protein
LPSALALRLTHQIMAIMVNEVEEIEHERNLSRFLFDTMHASQSHQHRLKGLFLLQVRVKRDRFAFFRS